MLPDIDGLEILRDIKEIYKIPVIMITAYGNKKVALKNWKYLPDYYLDKPFELKMLREKVREILNLPKETFPFETFGFDPSQLSPTILRVLEFIGSNLSNPKWIFKNMSLKDLSKVTTVSPRHLSLLFKKECGMSIFDMIISLKVDRAKGLLNQGKNIKEIAHELGYNNPKNFSRFIKNQTGKSPLEQRKKIT